MGNLVNEYFPCEGYLVSEGARAISSPKEREKFLFIHLKPNTLKPFHIKSCSIKNIHWLELIREQFQNPIYRFFG